MGTGVIVAVAMLIAACSGAGTGSEESAPVAAEVPQPEPEPEPEPDPEPDPEPVQLSGLFRPEGGDWVLSGSTNLPDGALIDYRITHWGSGCLDEACSEYEEWSDDDNSLYFDQFEGSVTVSGGEFSRVFDDWGRLVGICNTNTRSVEDWSTIIDIFFTVDQVAGELSDLISLQPAEIYSLYGSSGERLEVAGSVELIEVTDGAAAKIQAECAVS